MMKNDAESRDKGMLRPEMMSLLPWRAERVGCPRRLRGPSTKPRERTLRPRDLLEFALMGHKLALDQ